MDERQTKHGVSVVQTSWKKVESTHSLEQYGAVSCSWSSKRPQLYNAPVLQEGVGKQAQEHQEAANLSREKLAATKAGVGQRLRRQAYRKVSHVIRECQDLE